MLRIEFERLLRPALLHEAESRIEDDDGEDDRSVEPQAQHQLDEAGREKDINEDVIELGEEPHQRSLLLALGQAVRPVGLEPRRSLRGVEAAPGIDAKPPLDLLGGHGVPRRQIRSGVGRLGSAHGHSFLLQRRLRAGHDALVGTPGLPDLFASAEEMRRSNAMHDGQSGRGVEPSWPEGGNSRHRSRADRNRSRRTYLAFFSGPHRQPLSENIQSRARLARVPYGGCSASWIDEIRPCLNTGLSFEKVRKPS